MPKRRNIFFLSETGSNLDLSVVKFVAIGKQDSKLDYYYEPHNHVEYEFIYITSGEVRYKCDGHEYLAKKGDVYFVQPKQVHEEFSSSKFLSFYTLKFHSYNLKGEIEYLTNDYDKQFLGKQGAAFTQIFHKVFEEYKEKKHAYRQIVDSYVNELIYKTKRILAGKQTSKKENLNLDIEFSQNEQTNIITDKIIDIIQTNIGAFFKVTELAKMVAVSESYLFALFKRVYKMPPIKLMVSYKIEYSKKLLLQTDMSIAGISHYLGFGSPSHFSATFKKIEKISPKLYRLKHR